MRSLLLVIALAACGGTSPSGMQDLASAADMAGKPGDMSPGSTQCHTAGCRAFSSYCDTAPCRCIPLVADNPDPECNGAMVSCIVDPCDGKTATCNHGTGKCQLQ